VLAQNNSFYVGACLSKNSNLTKHSTEIRHERS
jgi:hypothetical protein